MRRDPSGRGRTRGAVALALVLSAFARPAWGEAPPDVVPPKLVQNSEPHYPEAKRAGGEAASVVLTLVVDAEGKVADAAVATSAGPEFDAAALAAARGLAFEPARRAGAPVPSKIAFRYDFRIEPPPAAPAAPAAAAALRGTVRAPSDEPLAGASVEVRAGGAPAARARTDAGGNFAFEGLAPGRVRVEVRAEGFEPFAADEELGAASATTVVYRPGPVAAGDDVVVRGARPPREVTKHSIARDEVRTMPGANGDPLRAVEAMPGVARAPGLDGQLVVRGSAPNDTLVLVDGTWVPTAYHFGGVSSVVPGDLLERIDYFPGNFGPEYGRVLGGVVELGVRSPRRDRIGGLAQVDLLDGRFVVEGPLGRRTRALVAGRRSWVDAWIGPALRSGGVGVTSAPVYYDWQALIEHDVAAHTTARLLFFGADDRLALVVNAPGAQDPTGGPLSARTTFSRLQARTETRLGDGSRWTNMLSWGTEDASYAAGTDRADTSIILAQGRSDLRARLARGLSATAGVDLLWAHYDVAFQLPANAFGDNEEDEATQSPFFGKARRRANGRGASIRPAAYATLEVAPVAGLKLLPGVRVDWSQDSARWTVDPRFAARWIVRPGPDATTLKGGVGVFHQGPLNEALKPWGRRPIEHPRAIHASAGVEQAFGENVFVSVEGFHKDLSGLFVTRADPSNPIGQRFVNAGDGRAYGLETLVRWKGGGRFFGWIAYTLSRSERREGPDESYRLFQYDQTHVLSALGSADLGRGWRLGARWRFVSGPLFTPYVGGVVDFDAGAYEPVAAAPFSSRGAPFHRLDVRLEKAWAVGPARLSAYLDVQNAYNRPNQEGAVYSYDYARSEPASGLPILPILGLRGEI